MSPVLSQAEVDALLAAVLDEDQASEVEAKKSGQPRPYDVTHGGKGLHEQWQILDVVSRRVAKDLRSYLMNTLRVPVEVKLSSKSTQIYSDTMRSLLFPTCMGVAELQNLNKPIAVNLDSELLFTVLEVLFGNTEAPGRDIENKDLTRVELGIAERMIAKVCAIADQAWKPIKDLDIKLKNFETHPQYLTFAQAEEQLIIHSLHVSILNVNAKMRLMYPASTLTSLKPHLIEAGQVRSKEHIAFKDSLFRHLNEASVCVQAVVAEKSINIKKLLSLAPGDVIEIENYKPESLQVYVEGKKKFLGKASSQHGRHVVAIK